jgi:hypothetical protein
MRYIGIDPGQAGGIAMLSDDTVPLTFKMPSTELDLLDVLFVGNYRSRACLEFVRSSPQMGVVSAFSFGRGYGTLRMALIAVGIPFEEVTPQKWQQAMQCRTRGDKNVTKRRAQELFPGLKVTHATADALLLAEYCRRSQTGII